VISVAVAITFMVRFDINRHCVWYCDGLFDRNGNWVWLNYRIRLRYRYRYLYGYFDRVWDSLFDRVRNRPVNVYWVWLNNWYSHRAIHRYGYRNFHGHGYLFDDRYWIRAWYADGYLLFNEDTLNFRFADDGSMSQAQRAYSTKFMASVAEAVAQVKSSLPDGFTCRSQGCQGQSKGLKKAHISISEYLLCIQQTDQYENREIFSSFSNIGSFH